MTVPAERGLGFGGPRAGCTEPDDPDLPQSALLASDNPELTARRPAIAGKFDRSERRLAACTGSDRPGRLRLGPGAR